MSNFRKVNLFLKELDQAQKIYLTEILHFITNLEGLIIKNNLSKDDVCRSFKISKEAYNDFISGNYNYTIYDLANLNAMFMLYRTEELKKNVPFKADKDA